VIGGATVVYCSPDDVVRVLQLGANSGATFSTTTTPTLAQVREYIVEAQEEIDSQTNHAWRPRQVSDEFFDFEEMPTYEYAAGIRISLPHRSIYALSNSGATDSLQVYTGGTYEEYLNTRTVGRGNDYWLDAKRGNLFLRLFYPRSQIKKVLLTYRYGETTVPKDIQKATALKVANMILVNEDKSTRLIESGDGGQMYYDQRYQKFQKEIDKILDNKTEFTVL